MRAFVRLVGFPPGGVEAHGTGLQDEVRVAEAVVIGAPAVADFVGGFPVIAETGLVLHVRRNDEDGRALGVLLVPLADDFPHGIRLFLGQGHIVAAGLRIGPGRGFLRGCNQRPDFGLADGFTGAETLPEAQRAEEYYYPIDGLKIPTVTFIQKSITTLLGKSNLELLTVFAERMQG